MAVWRTLTGTTTAVRAGVYAFLALAALMASPGLAAAAPQPIDGLVSSTHADTNAWYANGSPQFSWNAQTGVAGYTYTLDQNAASIPGVSPLSLPAVGFSFATQGVGANPWQVATGDVNGDGRVDLVTADAGVSGSDDGGVSVLLGNGDGTFAARRSFAASKSPHYVALGDLNGDGYPDLLVANYLSSNISVLLGNGDGTFRAHVDYPVGMNPHWLALRDLDNDGKLDVVVANGGTANSVSVLLGNGDGTLKPEVRYAAGTGAEAVVCEDFNADGKPDLAVANWKEPSVQVLLGNGDGTFQSKVSYAVGNGGHSIASADLNNDGSPDLIVANWTDADVSVLLGNGDGTFRAHVDYRSGWSPAAAVPGDFNGDGILDIAVTNNSATQATNPPLALSILLGLGDGTFRNKIDYACGLEPRLLAAADVDSDGLLDILVPHDTGSTVGVLRNMTPSVPPAATFAGKADGRWFFHVRAVDLRGVGGPTATMGVNIDKTAPVTSDDHASLSSLLAPITVTLSAADAGSGMSGGAAGTAYSIDGGAFVSGTSVVLGGGTHTVAYRSTDNAGNVESPDKSFTIEVVTPAPPVSTTTYVFAADASSGWRASTQTINLSASGGTVGLRTIFYSTDGGATWTAVAGDGATVVLSSEGSYRFKYYASNALATEATHDAGFVNIDKTAPTASDNAPTTWQKTTVTVTLSASDARSGIASVSYRVDSGVWTTGTSVSVSGDGVHTLEYYATDKAGNVSASRSKQVSVDSVGPTTYALAALNVTRGRTVSIPYRVNDLTPSATVTIVILKSQSTALTLAQGSKATNANLAASWVCSLPRGKYTWKVYATDLAGNQQTIAGTNTLNVQ
jgi:hypothetical protein